MKKLIKKLATIYVVMLVVSFGLVSPINFSSVVCAEDELEYTEGEYNAKNYSLLYRKYSDYIEIYKWGKSRNLIGTKISIDIPEKIDGVSVTSLINLDFGEDNVYIPDSVNYIVNFYGHVEKTQTEDINYIGNVAYSLRRKLTAEELENLSFKEGTKGIAFSFGLDYGDSITKIPVLPDSIECIGDNVFKGCTGLTEVILPDSVKVIGESAFADCENLETVYLPDQITNIRTKTFLNCEKLKNVSFPSKLRRIEKNAFENCKSLTSDMLNFPDSISYIAENAFVFCEGIRDFTFPAGIKTINIADFRVPFSYDKERWQLYSGNVIRILNPDCILTSKYTDGYTSITDNNGNWKVNKTQIMIGYPNSTAQKFAEEHGYTFITVEQAEKGDVNGDRSFNVADAVILQKYLLNARSFTKEDWKRSDLNNDDTVDIFDLALLKRELLETNYVGVWKSEERKDYQGYIYKSDQSQLEIFSIKYDVVGICLSNNTSTKQIQIYAPINNGVFEFKLNDFNYAVEGNLHTIKAGKATAVLKGNTITLTIEDDNKKQNEVIVYHKTE